MKSTFNFSVLKEDWENSCKEFDNLQECPAATAFKRQFPDFDFLMFVIKHVYGKSPSGGMLNKGFYEENFNALRDHGTEFHTTITFE